VTDVASSLVPVFAIIALGAGLHRLQLLGDDAWRAVEQLTYFVLFPCFLFGAIAFADFSGNRQYISSGNLTENPKAHLFLIDYAHRRRIKIWGEAKIVEGDDALLAQLTPEGYRARPEQVMIFAVTAWDSNCPQHIPQRFEAADVAAALKERDDRIAALEAEIKRLKGD